MHNIYTVNIVEQDIFNLRKGTGEENAKMQNIYWLYKCE